MFGEDLADAGMADGGVWVVVEHEDLDSGVGSADAEVSELAGVAEGDFAVWVDGVAAGAPLAGVLAVRGDLR